MAKVKEKLYEHRFGLFFFSLLTIYSFFVSGSLLWQVTAGVTKSIYAVDFTFGFRTKLLPGAIYNLLTDNFSDKAVSLYVQIIFIICIAVLSFFAEKAIKRFEKTQRSDIFPMVLITIIGFTVICFEAGFIALMDLHWIVAFMMFLLFLQNRKTYFLLPVPFLYAVMCHFASAICYIPLFFLIMLYKIIDTQVRKEKIYLCVVLAISALISVAICLYMIMFEAEGMKYTLNEFHEMLMLKGVQDFLYYDSAFYRDIAADLYQSAILENENIIRIDHTRSVLIVFLQTMLQRIQIHLSISEHKEYIIRYIVHLPAVIFVLGNLFRWFKKADLSKMKKFILFITPFFYVGVIVAGFLLSTDTARWLGHATIILFSLFLYFLYKEEALREDIITEIKKIPYNVLFIYIILYMGALFVI